MAHSARGLEEEMSMYAIRSIPWRFVPDHLVPELMNNYHAGRCMGGAYQAMIYACHHFCIAHPEISNTEAYKDLSAHLQDW